MPASREEYRERMRLGREKAARLRAEGLLPPRKNARAAAPSNPDDTSWMEEVLAPQTEAPTPLPITETPEFKAAVAAAVEASTASILDRLALKSGNGGGNTSDELSFARVLAAQIADLADQNGRGPKRVPAEEMEKRREARERLEALMVDVYAQNLEPEYEVTAACYLDEQLIDATWTDERHILRRTTIVWMGIPNEAMRPVNEIARRVHDEFLTSIGGETAPINRPDLGRKSLRVLHRDGALDGGPSVGDGQPKGMMRITGREGVSGQITMTNVLGTVAPPARQLA